VTRYTNFFPKSISAKRLKLPRRRLPGWKPTPTNAQGLIKLGGFDFLLKSFTLEVVEKSVKRALKYRRRLLEASASDKGKREGNPEEMNLGDWKILRNEPE
jgi:hypothetical protein